MSTLVKAWRDRWGRGEFPFYIVQLANYMSDADTPEVPSTWALLRESQREFAATTVNAGMACAIDIGEADDIHPRNKKEVGRRLALVALARTYEQAIESSGPVPVRATLVGDELVVEFEHAEGLHAKDDTLEKNFAISGAGGAWHWARARVEGQTVALRSDAVARPSRVRYGWRNNPRVNLYNGARLPAAPFEMKLDPASIIPD
jgi:sialate O-acetylesterase